MDKAGGVTPEQKPLPTTSQSPSDPNYHPDVNYYYNSKPANDPPSRSIYPFYPNYKSLSDDHEYLLTSEEPQSDYITSSSAPDQEMLGICSLTHTTRSFSVSGQSCVITPQVLQAADGETVDLDLVYVIKEVTSGSVLLSQGRYKQQVSNFTQRQINNGDVVFQHQYSNGS